MAWARNRGAIAERRTAASAPRRSCRSTNTVKPTRIFPAVYRGTSNDMATWTERQLRGPRASSMHGSDVLVDEDGVAVWVDEHEVLRPGRRLVGGPGRRDARTLELALQLSHIGESFELLLMCVPAGVEGEHVALEHALEQADGRR